MCLAVGLSGCQTVCAFGFWKIVMAHSGSSRVFGLGRGLKIAVDV